MVWVLIWMQLSTTQAVNYYQLGTFPTQAECTAALSNATVMVTHKSETVACLEVEVNQ